MAGLSVRFVVPEGLNDRLAAMAKAGKVVGRVKNGDPLVFGRGAEEAEA